MTRAELTTYVLARLGVGSERAAFATQVVGHLNRAYVREVTALGLNMDESTLVFTADDPVVSLPADWRRTETLRVGSRILIEKTPAEHLQMEAGHAGGATIADGPSYVVLYPPARYRIVPPPSTSATEGVLIYHAAPALLTSDSSVPTAIPEEYHDLLGELAIARMASNQEDPQLSQEALANAALIRSMLLEERAQGAGTSANRVRRKVYG